MRCDVPSSPNLASGPRSRYLRQEGPSLVLHLDEHDWVDYSAFEALLAEAGTAGDPLPQLEAAATLYGGDLLPEEQDVWCVAAREALRLRWHGVLLALAEAQAGRRQSDRAQATLARLLGVDRTNEEAARRLMGMLARQGRRAEAMQIFNRLAAALKDELDTVPAPETESLFDALQAGTAPRQRTNAAATSPIPAGMGAGETARPAPPLVGRNLEVARIHAGLEAARDGQHHALLLAGDAGMGKTYLANEAVAMATILGYVVLSGHAGEGEVDLPYAVMAEALRCYIRARPLAALRRELAGAEALVELLPELAQPPLALLAPAPLEHQGAARLRLWNAVLALLTAATQRPILLLIEDMHWADSASLGLITFLIRRGKGLRWLLLGTLRPEHEAVEHPVQRLIREGKRAGTLELLELEGLSPDEVGEMACAPGGVPLTEAEVAVLHEQCAGNPLFVREVLNLIVSGDEASTTPRTAGAAINGAQALPRTIRQAFLQQVDRRSGECRALLQAAATIGGRFPTELLAQVPGQDPGTFGLALDEAVESGLLREETVDGMLSLRHPLLQRTLYEEIAPSVRSKLHGRVATALIERSVGRADPDPALLAYHFGGAHEPLAAARWLERAADLAGEVHGQAEAIAQYEQALAAVDGCRAELLDGAEWGAWRARLHEKLGDRLIVSRAYEAAREHYRQAFACLPSMTNASDDREALFAIGGPVRRAELRRKEAVALDRAGNHDDALAAFAAAGAEGIGLVGGAGALPAPLLAAIAVGQGMAHRGAGRGAEAEAAIRRALALLDGVPEGATLSQALSLQGQLAHERGDDEVAEQSHLRSLAIRERSGDQQGAAGCWYNLGMLAYDRGALPEAERRFERSLAIREGLGDAWGSAFGWHKLGQIAQARANYGRAEECYRASLRIGERIGNQPGIADASFNLGQVARARGDYAEAERCFQRSLAIQERLGDEAGLAASIGDIAEVARDRGDLRLAESLARRSLAIHERLHDQLGVATCLVNLGLIAAERGDHAGALRDSRQARRLARTIAARRTECSATLAQAGSAIQSGRHRLAAALLGRCIALNTLDGSTRTAALIGLLQGESALQQGWPDQASAAARAAFRCAAGQFRREEARAQRLLGRCEAARGYHGEAERLLRAALSTYEEIGASIEIAGTQGALARCLRSSGSRRVAKEEAKRLDSSAAMLLRAAGIETQHPKRPRQMRADRRDGDDTTQVLG